MNTQLRYLVVPAQSTEGVARTASFLSHPFAVVRSDEDITRLRKTPQQTASEPSQSAPSLGCGNQLGQGHTKRLDQEVQEGDCGVVLPPLEAPDDIGVNLGLVSECDLAEAERLPTVADLLSKTADERLPGHVRKGRP